MTEEVYNLARFVYKDTKITADGFKTTWKIDTEERTATDSHDPYSVVFKGNSYEWELSDVDPSYRQFFTSVIEYQQENPNDLAMISTYDFNEYTGDLVEDDVYYGAYVKELGKEKANDPFTVKGGALRRKKLNK